MSPCSTKVGSAAANTGRNTTIIRSNYLWEESEVIYEHALRLGRG